MAATQVGDGRWRCNGCGNLFVNRERAEQHHPTETGAEIEQAAAVVSGLVTAFGQVEHIAGAAVQVIEDSSAVHAEQDAKWAELKATVDDLNARLKATVARLNAAGVPEVPPAPETPPDTPPGGEG